MDTDASACPCTCHDRGLSAPACSITGGCDWLHTVEHRCRRANRCADWEWVDITAQDGTRSRARIGRPINSANGLCPTCTRDTAYAILDLARDYVELSLIVGAIGSSGYSEPVAGSRDLPIPLRLGVLTVLEGIVSETTCLAETVADRMRVTWDSTLVDRHTRPGVAVQRATRLLAGGLSVLLAVRDWPRMVWAQDGWTVAPETRDGVDGALALLDLHHQARRLAGRTRVVYRMPGGCPGCERRSLVREDGDDTIYCTRCPRQYTPTEYGQVVHALAASWPAAA